MKKTLVIVVLFALFVKVYFMFVFKSLWWDSAVYAGMGKYIFSAGTLGLWEPLRPMTLPAILGSFWYVDLDMVLCWKILQLLISGISVVLLYYIASSLFDKRTAILSSALLSSSYIIVLMSTQLYTEILALFFVLLSVFFALKKSPSLSAGFFVLSVLSKFPVIFLFPGLFVMFMKNKRQMFSFGLWSLIFIAPFLLLNMVLYHDPVFPFVEAHEVILKVVGCNFLHKEPWFFYFGKIFSENFLYLLVPFGIFMSVKYRKPQAYSLAACLIVPLAYFSYLPCRDYRYMIVFLPFIALFSAYALVRLTKKIRLRIFYLVVLGILIVSSSWTILKLPKDSPLDPEVERYYHFLENKRPKGEVWTSNPMHSLYSDTKLHLVYYPVYDGILSEEFLLYLRNQKNISYVLLDTCDGGIICSPFDAVCARNLQETFVFLRTNYHLSFQYEKGTCLYYVFEPI